MERAGRQRVANARRPECDRGQCRVVGQHRDHHVAALAGIGHGVGDSRASVGQLLRPSGRPIEDDEIKLADEPGGHRVPHPPKTYERDVHAHPRFLDPAIRCCVRLEPVPVGRCESRH